MARLQLRNEEIFGRRLDVMELLKDHPSTGRFRVMVMQAAARILEGRGALTNIKAVDIKKRREPGEK